MDLKEDIERGRKNSAGKVDEATRNSTCRIIRNCILKSRCSCCTTLNQGIFYTYSLLAVQWVRVGNSGAAKVESIGSKRPIKIGLDGRGATDSLAP